MIWFIIIYIIGYLLAYICDKIHRNYYRCNHWEGVIDTFCISFLSWMYVILFLIIILPQIIKIDNNPSKWL